MNQVSPQATEYSMPQSANVDDKEISKFNEIAFRWWDPESEFKPLHDINPLRLDYINKHSPLNNKNVIDVGCGGGLLSEGMSKLGAKVTGIDMGERPIQVAKLHLHESKLDINYQQTTAENFAEQHAGQFEVVSCMEMLEHVPDPGSVIRACSKLVKPGGKLFFSTINRNPKSYLYAILGAEYMLQMLPKGTHDYKKMIKPSELARWMRSAEVDLVDISGMAYNPVSKHYSLNKDITVNYLCYAEKSL